MNSWSSFRLKPATPCDGSVERSSPGGSGTEGRAPIGVLRGKTVRVRPERCDWDVLVARVLTLTEGRDPIGRRPDLAEALAPRVAAAPPPQSTQPHGVPR